MSKSSNLNLYSSDNLEEKCLHVVSVDAKLSLTSPNEFELNAPKFKLAGQTTSAHDIADLGLYLKTLSDLQSSDNATQTAAIATNTTSIATLDTKEQANHAAQAALLGAETSRATTAETQLQTNVDAEAVLRTNADNTLQTNITAEANARTTAISTEETARISGDAGLQSQIDALGVVDTTTLAQINQMLADYQNADNTISGLITALTTRVSDLEAQVDALTE